MAVFVAPFIENTAFEALVQHVAVFVLGKAGRIFAGNILGIGTIVIISGELKTKNETVIA
jgi:hypothetical protein